MNQELLKEYAKLIVKTGVNVQEGQAVIISINVEDAYFVPYVMEEAYKAGAKSVDLEWRYQAMTKLKYEYETAETLSEIPTWKEEKMKWEVENLPCMIYIESSDPDGLKGIDQNKMMEVQKAAGPIRMKYREQMDNKYQWTIVGIPQTAWAKKVFPDLSEEDAMNALWEAIIKVTRLEGNAVENWNQHNANLKDKVEKLNALNIQSLHYQSANGTDFTIGLDECVQFEAGGATTLNNVYYNPNMPTEECFTSPNKHTASGVVMATKPLSVRGVLVENFGFRFENGKVVEVIGDDLCKEVLGKLVATDEGAAMLGEVALVPYDSPINQTNILFYNTLYDENACCHLALGRAFNECIIGYESMTEEEIKAVDLNNSIIHVDFMIGSSDLSIIATTYGNQEVQIFKDGVFAI